MRGPRALLARCDAKRERRFAHNAVAMQQKKNFEC
ncbi:hypothetical protein X566_05040 [Afipia sp. P52-10]|nr:hypothetical protein X566_05040 [Afipia sp. P52-10]